jgi:pimeloyl-ACP methyl ester carboxylesterase
MTVAKRLPGLEERWTEIRGVSMRYSIGGDGPPVVLVHGLSGSAANWAAVAPLLVDRCRVLVPDLPGHAGSAGLPAARNLSPYADIVHELARRHALLPAVVAGHSFGGAVALRFGARHPASTAGLVLAGSAGLSSATTVGEVVLAAMASLKPGRRIARFQRRIAPNSLLRTLVFGFWGTPDAASLSPQAVAALLGDVRLHTDVWGAGRALVGEDTRALLEAIQAPTTVLWGADDRLTPLADGFELTRLLGAELRIVADCGHLLVLERPAACADAIASAAGEVRPGSEAR